MQHLGLPGQGRGKGRPVDSAALAQVLDEFAATVTGEFSIQDILRQLARGATRVLDLAGAGVAAPDESGELLHLVHSTQPQVDRLERLQEELQEGPCRDSHFHGRVINLREIGTEGRWPRYQRLAAELGIHAVATIPLRARDQGWA